MYSKGSHRSYVYKVEKIYSIAAIYRAICTNMEAATSSHKNAYSEQVVHSARGRHSSIETSHRGLVTNRASSIELFLSEEIKMDSRMI